MIYKELPISFPWYDNLQQQNRYNENVEPVCDYKLITPRDALLPFQFYKTDVSGALPTEWKVFNINTNMEVADLAAEIPTLHRIVLEGREYFTHFGGALAELNLPTGYYYSRMFWADGAFFYSEMFYVPEKSFLLADDQNVDYLKLTWYNMNDLNPIYYHNYGMDGLPKFKQVVYLDTFITASEPSILEDGERDGTDELVPTFQKGIISYRITDLMPDFLKKALVLSQMHDFVGLTTKKGVRTGQLDTLKVNSTLDAFGALSTVDIIFHEAILLKKGCGVNMV